MAANNVAPTTISYNAVRPKIPNIIGYILGLYRDYRVYLGVMYGIYRDNGT